MAEKNKKIDGIKKLNKEEAAKSRRIVLEMIGEAAAIGAPPPEAKKSVDGLAGRNIPEYREPEQTGKKPEPAPSAGQKKRWRDEVEKFLPVKPKAQDGRLPGEAGQIAPDFMKAAGPSGGIKAAGRRVTEPAPVKGVLPDESAAKEIAAVRRAQALKENAAREREAREKAEREHAEAARQAEQKKREEENKKRAEAHKRERADAIMARRRAKREKRQKFFEGLRKRTVMLRIRSLNAARASVYYMAVAAVMFSLFYSILAVAELKFDADNRLTRGLSAFVPVPAIVTKYGLIEYYEYKDMHNDSDGRLAEAGIEPIEEIKYRIARKVVYDKLKNKYGAGLETDNGDEEARLAEYLVRDSEVNLEGIARITKIKEMIDSNGDFVQVASKYGDELGQVTITPDNRENYSYSAQVEKLAKNEISDIVIAPDGYYIFRCYEKTGAQTALSYAFVRAKTLDQHIEEAAKRIKMWSLVK